jgi:futalosine hydrolase
MRAALPAAAVGPILTVATVTGTATGAAAILARHPDAVAEAMEGFGVATAAAQAGVAFGELRAISNPVGSRDRDTWRIGDALAALGGALAAVGYALAAPDHSLS